MTPDREATRVPGTAAENPPFEPSIVPRDIGEATVAPTRPARMAINEILVRPTEQEW